MNLLANMDNILITYPLEVKINMLGSIISEKIEFDGKKYRADIYNEVLDIILKNVSQLYEKKGRA